jgi:hypothetical protein
MIDRGNFSFSEALESFSFEAGSNLEKLETNAFSRKSNSQMHPPMR